MKLSALLTLVVFSLGFPVYADWGAFCWNKDSNRVTEACGHPSAEAANERAQLIAGIVVGTSQYYCRTFSDTCFAWAWNERSTQPLTYSSANGEETARSEAVDACRSSGGQNCQIVASCCS